jgi:hypothetical protein
MRYDHKMIVKRAEISSNLLSNINSANKFIVLSALGALMITATMALKISEVDATSNATNNFAINSSVGQQNTGDTSASSGSGSSSVANGGNSIGGDLTIAGPSN